jgi:hypothetical protein
MRGHDFLGPKQDAKSPRKIIKLWRGKAEILAGIRQSLVQNISYLHYPL